MLVESALSQSERESEENVKNRLLLVGVAIIVKVELFSAFTSHFDPQSLWPLKTSAAEWVALV